MFVFELYSEFFSFSLSEKGHCVNFGSKPCDHQIAECQIKIYFGYKLYLDCDLGWDDVGVNALRANGGWARHKK